MKSGEKRSSFQACSLCCARDKGTISRPQCSTAAPEVNDLLSTPAGHGLSCPWPLIYAHISAVGHSIPPPKQNDVHTRQARIRSQICQPQSPECMDMLLYTPKRDFAEVIKVRDLELGTLSWIIQAQFYPESLKSENLSLL